MKKRKWWILGVGLLALALLIVWSTEAYLKKRIKEELQIQTVRGDTVQVSRVDLGLMGGWMDINDLVVRWNVDPGASSEAPAAYLVQGRVGKIKLRGLSFLQYLLNHEIFIRELFVDSSYLDLFLLPGVHSQTSTAENKGSNSRPLHIDIADIQLAPSRIRYFEEMDSGKPSLEVARLELELRGFHFPRRPANRSFISFVNWSAGAFRYGRPGHLSDLIVREAGGNSTDSTFFFSGLYFRPRYSREDYSRLLKHKNSRIDIAVARGKIERLDWMDLLSKGRLRAGKFMVDSCTIEVYEDAGLPVDESRSKSLYQEKLLNAGLGITVDSALVRNARLTYLIRPEEPGEKLGALEFHDMQADFHNITNDSARIAARPLLRAEINSVLNGESKLHNYFTFDLSSPKAAYSYAGEMHGFELPEFNTILIETSRMKITQGKMQHLTFSVDADKQVARGEMRIDYSDLKIEWLDRHNILAALAQKVVMREKNPKNGNYRIGQIYYERQPFRSFWNYFVKSLLSGLNSTAMPNLLLPEELDSRKEKK